MDLMANRFLKGLWSGYRFAALTLLNTLIALAVLNGILRAVFAVKDHFSRNPVSTKYGNGAVVYPGLSEREVDHLLKETWSRPYVFEPFTQFKERPYRGSYVNVDTNGFRITKHQGPWPPESKSLNIFLFGGSTTFGYGVPDGQTVASYLQEYLTTRLNREVHLYNFGRGYYYSTQERILYEELLASGFVPDMAIFIDGLNDFYYIVNEPAFSDEFREFVAHGTTRGIIKSFISKTSLGRAVRGFGHRLANLQSEKYSDPQLIDRVITRYLANKKVIEAVSISFGVKPIFVWQPAPTYHYDQRYYPFSKGGFREHSYSQHGYERMAEYIEKHRLGKNFLWCADIQKDEKEPMYVDKVHYSADFSKQFATAIVDLLFERHLVEPRSERSE